MAADIQTLLGQSSCLQCLLPGQRELVGLALLNNIAGNNSATPDVAALLASASCFQCLSPGEREIVELALLQAIATALGV
jgi:hypothetical protein